ncbi:L-2-hydroxyglutarate oxidase LhgO [Nymphon striatum]|nr:L-2-hydroxyglutarate oxidase LhgO [Nymphon striatum]
MKTEFHFHARLLRHAVLEILIKQNLRANSIARHPPAPKAAPKVSNAKLPFDLPIMPGARYISGSGIVGLSTAMQLQQTFPEKKVLVITAAVIHAGVYYAPGSLKADFCKRGVKATLAFCAEHDIKVEQCGKLLVATNQLELERMDALYERCLENGLEVELLSENQLKAREPNITGLGAIFAKDTGIVDYQQVSMAMARHFEKLGGEARLNNEGLMADRTTRMLGIETDFQIIPFRGEYYQLPTKYNDIVKHLIYPIPDPELPFLGVHLTRMIDGTVTVGPNAVQGWKREGYGRLNINFRDILDMIKFKGIRAQAVLSDGTLVHDFLFAESPRSLHVCNAPSPAATSAIPIWRTAEAPCPHHSMSDVSQQEVLSTTTCECSNCNCINVLSSLLIPIEAINSLQIDDSHDSSFIISAFPDSPPSFILRPPIS